MDKSRNYSSNKHLNNFIKQNFGNVEVGGPCITESCIVISLDHSEKSVLDVEINARCRFLEHQLHQFLHLRLNFWEYHALRFLMDFIPKEYNVSNKILIYIQCII